jgi:glucose-6-phosphate dehydrogenase assembly protein OpcA
MTNKYKVLGQLNPAANTQTTLYTVPSSNSAVISSVTVCNQGSTVATFSIAVQVAGATITNKQYLNFNTPVPANDTIHMTLGMTLAATDVISANANTTSVSFNVFGSEIY